MPAPFSLPCAQFRKGARLFDNYIVFKLFSLDLSPFRAWTGADREAGSWQGDAIRNIQGAIYSYILNLGNGNPPSGALKINTSQQGLYTVGSGGYGGEMTFDASRAVPTGPENVPQHIVQPIVLYLGRPTEV